MKIYELNEKLAENGFGIVYEMSDLDDVLSDRKATEILNMTVMLGNFDLSHQYFQFDDNGNLVSYLELEELIDLYNDFQ